MKKIFMIMFLFSALTGFSQNTKSSADDMGRIALAAFVPQQIDKMPEAARSLLKNKLSQIVTKSGMGGSAAKERFIITANVNVLTKDVLPSAPPLTQFNLEVTFYIGDGIEGTKFTSTSVSVKGTGENETKAYIAALKNISPSNPEIQSFVEAGKTRIVEYYNSKCDFILKEAQSLASQNKYDESISKLISIPEVCKACYDKAMDAVAPIYQKQIDRACKQRLMEATTAWNAAQDLYSAENAGAILSQIEPGAACYKDAQVLSSKIAQRVKELDQREWKFQMKQQQDDVDIQKATIKAARDIGVAYGNNQPDVVYKVYGWW
jgi:hypothetical protein